MISQRHFDRYNLHAIGKEITAEIEENKKLLGNLEKPLNPENKDLYRRMGIYYALFARSNPDAKPYLEKYLQLAEENTYEQAEAYGFLAYIEIIQGGYHESHENTPLTKALNILKNLDPYNMENIGLRLFLEKYVPLMRYRDSYLNLPKDDKRPFIEEDMKAAINGIKSVIEESEKYSTTNVDIDRAESFHLLAAMQIKQGLLAEARKNLEIALQLERDFSKRIAQQLNHDENKIIYHWMTYTTGQTLADLYRREKNYDESIILLHQVLKGQREFFHPLNNHPDIAKTLDFLANSYKDKGDLENAFDYYLQTLEMKEKVLNKNSVLIKVTLESLYSLMDQNPEFYNHKKIAVLNEILKKIEVQDIAQKILTKSQNTKQPYETKNIQSYLFEQPSINQNNNKKEVLQSDDKKQDFRPGSRIGLL